MTLQGRKDERLRIAAIYRPNPGYPTDGLTTVWSQQRVRLQELAFLNNDVVEIDPREQCLTDFKKWINEKRENRAKVVALTNSNQTATERTIVYRLRLAHRLSVEKYIRGGLPRAVVTVLGPGE